MFSFINKNYDWFKWYRRIRFPILIPLPKGVILFNCILVCTVEVNCILVCGRTKDKQTFRNILSSCNTRYSPESNRNNTEVLSFFKEVFHFCLINSSSKTKTQATWPRYATFLKTQSNLTHTNNTEISCYSLVIIRRMSRIWDTR